MHEKSYNNASFAIGCYVGLGVNRVGQPFTDLMPYAEIGKSNQNR
jgi:hypothetical protein